GEDVEIVRGTLCQILMDHTSNAEFIFGDSIQAISQSSYGVQVEFTKNSRREFDLVIGADGLHSNVRRIVFGDESRFAHGLGLYLGVYTVPNYLNLDRLEMQYTVVLVGDAGYCASPMSGQGTSLALIGAYVLAGEAAASGAYQAAFRQYE